MMKKKRITSYIFYTIALLAIWLVVGSCGAMSEGFIQIKQGVVQSVLGIAVAIISVCEAYKIERGDNGNG